MDFIHVIIDVRVKNQTKFQEYINGHLPTIEKYGGKVTLKSKEIEVLEGDWSPKLIVVQQWPSKEIFLQWYNSEAYKPWKEFRKDACDLSLLMVQF